jgi:hypothetical protein
MNIAGLWVWGLMNACLASVNAILAISMIHTALVATLGSTTIITLVILTARTPITSRMIIPGRV